MPILLRRLLHYAAYLLGGVAILLSVIALTLRLVVMPHIDAYRADVEALASKAVGMPVRIAALQADWWRLNPRLGLRGVELSPPGQPIPLKLPQVDATLSWLTLLLGEPRLARLDLLQPALEIRRDAAGVIFVAGIPVNQPGEKSLIADWILRQHDVTVSAGRIVWVDEQLGAPPLVLDRLNLRLVNRRDRHRFGLTAQPPADSIRALDVRGDLRGPSVHDLSRWQGRFYMQMQQASAQALLRWIPWAQQQVKRGSGDARLWLDVAQGRLQGVRGDVRASHVAVSLAEDLPDMTFRALSGRLDWRMDKGEHVFRVEGLRFVSDAGQDSAPALVNIRVKPSPDGKVERAQVTVNKLRLEALTALSHAIPLPPRMRDWIARHNPRGFLETVDVAWLGKERFRIRTRFQDAGMSATPELPGFAGLDGEIEADEGHGQVRLASKGLFFDYARVFRQPLAFARLDARLGWTKAPTGGYRIVLERGQLTNSDLDGEVSGTLEILPGQAPVADIRAQLKRGEGNAVWKYLPWQVSDNAYHWVKRSIRSGHSPNTRLVLRGPLDQFPFAKGGGEFLVAVKADNAVLDYAPDWPVITGIHGWLVFKGLGLTITANQAQILAVPLEAVRAAIPDIHHAGDNLLTVDGSAAAPIAHFLDFVRKSPVFGYTGRFTETVHAEGQGALKLHLELPLHDFDHSRVSGQVLLTDNRIVTGRNLPTLTNVNGTLDFTEKGIRGQKLSARIFGEPTVLDLASEREGRVGISLEGKIQAKTLGEWLPADVLRHLSGSAAYRAEVGLRQQKTEYKVASDLAGLAIRLPAPFGKAAAQARQLSVRATPQGPDGDEFVQVQYGDIVNASILRPGQQDTRIGVLLGSGEPVLPEQTGISVQGALQKLDLDAWQRFWTGDGAAEAVGGAPPVRAVNITFNEFKVFNRLFHDMNIHATPVEKGWRLQLAGSEVVGEAIYDEPGRLPGKRLIGRFQKFQWPREVVAGSPQTGGSDDIAELPRIIDLNAKEFTYAGRSLGALSAFMEAQGNGLNVRTLTLASPDGRLEGSGWLSASSRRLTELHLKLETPDSGRLMTRLGYPEGIKGGAAQFSGKISWMGRPEDLRLEEVNGQLKVELQNGRFSRMDPGVGRLLGIFSLQALPRRIVLDFRDVFSEGFAFDRIEGDVHIERGALYLPGLQINGPAAKVRMNGKVDPVAETQNLRLLIQPRLDEGAALAGALLGGPVVGLGALVASKILHDPIAKAASFEYLVSGGWDEPLVTKLSKTQSTVQSLP